MDQGSDSPRIISIHALRVEGDGTDFEWVKTDLQFQSTPSVWRATDMADISIDNGYRFQSTPSVWRATLGLRKLSAK